MIDLEENLPLSISWYNAIDPVISETWYARLVVSNSLLKC